jgi:hypothetical protein
LAEESDAAEDVAVLEAEVWLDVVRRGLNVAVLAAVEAQGLGGLVVLLRAAGVDVVAAREGPRALVRLDDREDPWGGASLGSTTVRSWTVPRDSS